MEELTKREMEILLLLLREQDWVTGEEISRRLNISRKTVQQEIRRMETVLGDSLCAGQKKGYRLERLPEEQLREILSELEENEEHYNMKDRTSVIALYLLFQQDFVTMDRLAECFFLSKSTVFSEIKTLKRWMGRQGGIALEVSGVRGVRVLGREQDRRFRCATFCMPGILRQIPLEEEELCRYETELSVIRRELGMGLSRCGFLICGEDFGKACRYLAVSLLRDRLGFSMEEENGRQKEGYGPEEKAVKEILSALEQALSCRFSAKEAAGLGELLACSRTPGGDRDPGTEWEELPGQARERAEEMLEKLESALREILGLSPGHRLFGSREQFFRHLIRMERRLRWGRNATNYYDKELAAAGPLETYAMELAWRRAFGRRLPRAELMFLTAYLDPELTQEQDGVRVLLVSNQSAGITDRLERFVRQSLTCGVSGFSAEPVYLFEAEGGKTEENCLALTTEGETALLHPEFIQIPVVLRTRDRKRIRQLMEEWETEREEREAQRILSRYGRKARRLEGGGRLSDLLESIGWDGEECSVSPLQDELLYLCRFRKDEEPSVCLYLLERPADVERKNVRRVLAVSWNGEREGRASFFRTVSLLLSEGSSVQKRFL